MDGWMFKYYASVHHYSPCHFIYNRGFEKKLGNQMNAAMQNVTYLHNLVIIPLFFVFIDSVA